MSTTKVELTQVQHFFSETKFVCSAVAKESTRYTINRLLVEDNLIVATDGKRLHVHYFNPNNKAAWWENGYYEIIKNMKSKIVLLKDEDCKIKFPDFRSIIPHYHTFFEIASGYEWFKEKVLCSLGKQNIAIDVDFLRPFVYVDRDWDIYFDSPTKAIRFVSYNRYKHSRLEAIVMPTNVGIEDVNITSKSIRRHMNKAS